MMSSRPTVERRTPRPRKTQQVTEGVDTSQGGWSSKQIFFNSTTDMQERLRQKLRGNSPPTYLGEGELPSLIDSFSEMESVTQSKTLMSPKYKDSNRLKQTSSKPITILPNQTSLKSPSHSSLKSPKFRPESAAPIGQPLSVRFTVTVAQRPQTSGRLKKGRTLTSPLSAAQLGPKSLHLA
jgi:hypothetical protein